MNPLENYLITLDTLNNHKKVLIDAIKKYLEYKKLKYRIYNSETGNCKISIYPTKQYNDTYIDIDNNEIFFGYPFTKINKNLTIEENIDNHYNHTRLRKFEE